ncbi:hypothetical protein C6P98_04655 [Burkholderia multivorans]|uniref:Uncharacterized protein n=1 Tax=Burkholderia multivorans TaxID=87883 RepID=A0A8E2UTC4_9BURK|nr:hypothetical protein [Burkholderia multivorans]PRF27114.1 hypothetical protein C6P98_04655 [Burkholderia multivorans]
MDSNDFDLSADDFIAVDIYHQTLDEMYDKVMFWGGQLFRKSKNDLWEISEKDRNPQLIQSVLDEFQSSFVAPLLADMNLDPYEMPTNFSKSRKQELLDYLRTSCSWAILSRRASEAGDEHKGWVCMCHAQFWLGRARQVSHLPTTVKRIASASGRKGSDKRDEKYRRLRELARDLAAAGNYPSKRNAALSIKETVLKESVARKVNMSEAQAEKTITGWLEGMTFARKKVTR